MKVKLIEMNEHVALVEYLSGAQYKRCVIPASRLAGDDAEPTTLFFGVHYGEEWERLIGWSSLPDVVANELRRRGIWLVEEAKARPDEVKSAFIAAAVDALADFMRAVKEVHHGE